MIGVRIINKPYSKDPTVGKATAKSRR